MGVQKKGNERENGIFIREKGRKVFYFSRVPKLKCSDSWLLVAEKSNIKIYGYPPFYLLSVN